MEQLGFGTALSRGLFQQGQNSRVKKSSRRGKTWCSTEVLRKLGCRAKGFHGNSQEVNFPRDKRHKLMCVLELPPGVFFTSRCLFFK